MAIFTWARPVDCEDPRTSRCPLASAPCEAERTSRDKETRLRTAIRLSKFGPNVANFAASSAEIGQTRPQPAPLVLLPTEVGFGVRRRFPPKQHSQSQPVHKVLDLPRPVGPRQLLANRRMAPSSGGSSTAAHGAALANTHAIQLDPNKPREGCLPRHAFWDSGAWPSRAQKWSKR